MDVKEAVQAARTYISDLFDDEGITNVGLEEVEFDMREEAWNITIGFSRVWERQGDLGARLGLKAARSYKVVRIDNDSSAIRSVRDRTLPAIAK